MKTARVLVSIEWPQLSCFGCRTVTDPKAIDLHCPGHTETIRITGEVRTLPVIGETALAAELLVPDLPGYLNEYAVLAAADAQGWRKVRFYGHEIHLCPACVKHRERPEWARRLVEKEEKPK